MLKAATACALVLLASMGAAGGDGKAGIAWKPGLAAAFEEAKASKKPLFIAINAKNVEGEQVEAASRHLREDVYPHARVVERSRAFVCVLLRDPISSDDGAQLRSRFSIEGLIVSPQHLWVHSDGTLIERKEYWEHSDVAESVEALVSMMGVALKAHEAHLALPALGPDAASRSAWIAAARDLVRTSADIDVRRAAARELAGNDRKGDCLAALESLLVEAKDVKKEEVPAYVEVVRLLGLPENEAAVPALSAMLDAKDPALRANAAVSLEYVGSAKAVPALLKRSAKEKDDQVHCDLLRATGRCGTKDASVRKTLTHEAAGKSDPVAVGAIIGLAHFSGDADAARGLEKCWKDAEEGLRRAAILWALVEIHDPKTADFLRGELANGQKFAQSYRLVQAASACFEGRVNPARSELDSGLRWGMTEKKILPDAARAGRREAKYVPKGDE